MTATRRALRVALVLSFAVVPFTAACSGSGSSALPERTSSPLRSETVSPPATSTRSGFTRPPTSEPPAVSTTKPAVVPTRSKAPTQAPPVAAAPTGATVTTAVPATSTPAPEPSVDATQAAATTGDDSTPWGWILLAVAVAGAIIGIAMLVHSRTQRRRLEAWRQQTRGAVDAAFVARDLLPVHGRDIADLPHWESVRATADQAAADLHAASGSAPAPDAAAAANDAAEALSGSTFALESSRLVQAAQPPPSAAQLAEADALVQTRNTVLDTALARLRAVVSPPAPGGEPLPAT